MKKLLILGIVIGVLVAAYFILYFIDVSGQILEVRRPTVTVKSMEERNYTEKGLIQRGISSEQAKDIVNHPNQYRRVFLTFDLHNRSAGASVVDIQIEVHLPEEATQRLVWMEDNLSFPYAGTKEEHPDGVIAFFKLERGGHGRRSGGNLQTDPIYVDG